MKKYWARRSDGQIIDVSRAIRPQDRQFAQSSLGTIHSRYELELAIELLSREADGLRFAASNKITRAEGPGVERRLAA